MDDVKKLIQDLKSEDVILRRCAALELGKIGDTSAVPALVKTLGDKKFSVRWAASEALLDIGKPAVPALVKALGDEDTDMSRGAARVLADIRDASVVDALVEALKDGNWRVIESAVEALANIGTVPALVEALGDEDSNVREGAARALRIIVDNCATIEVLNSSEKDLKEGFVALRKKHPDRNELIETKMKIARLMKKISEKKNELASKKDMFLDVKPKPPKGGRMYQAARMVRNG